MGHLEHEWVGARWKQNTGGGFSPEEVLIIPGKYQNEGQLGWFRMTDSFVFSHRLTVRRFFYSLLKVCFPVLFAAWEGCLQIYAFLSYASWTQSALHVIPRDCTVQIPGRATGAPWLAAQYMNSPPVWWAKPLAVNAALPPNRTPLHLCATPACLWENKTVSPGCEPWISYSLLTSLLAFWAQRSQPCFQVSSPAALSFLSALMLKLSKHLLLAVTSLAMYISCRGYSTAEFCPWMLMLLFYAHQYCSALVPAFSVLPSPRSYQ